LRSLLLRLLRSRWSLLIPIPFWGVIASVLYLFNQQTLDEAAHEMARLRGEAVFQLVQTMRHWNAEHGGVYVPVTLTTPVNPYLDAEEKVIYSPTGRALTLLNPAYMTRQLADRLRGSDLEIQLTSLNLFNPDNAADLWEAEALDLFLQTGQLEYVSIDNSSFRYIAAMQIEPNCLPCHQAYGYELGDLRGGLSVSFPKHQVLDLAARLQHDSFVIHLIAFLALSLSGCLSLYGFRQLILGLDTEKQQREAIIQMRTSELREEVAQRKASQEQLHYLAHHDELTGASNRRWFFEKLNSYIERHGSETGEFGVLMLDIDHFKRINDTYGHDTGDRVLIWFVSCVESLLRYDDLLGRVGGEEFMVLLPHSNTETALEIAERIRAGVAANPVELDLSVIPVSISVGVAVAEVSGVCTAELVRAADKALYEAKQGGRNRVVLAKSAQ